jgi:hypothetical protein
MRPSETSVLTRVTQHQITKDSIIVCVFWFVRMPDVGEIPQGVTLNTVHRRQNGSDSKKIVLWDMTPYRAQLKGKTLIMETARCPKILIAVCYTTLHQISAYSSHKMLCRCISGSPERFFSTWTIRTVLQKVNGTTVCRIRNNRSVTISRRHSAHSTVSAVAVSNRFI